MLLYNICYYITYIYFIVTIIVQAHIDNLY